MSGDLPLAPRGVVLGVGRPELTSTRSEQVQRFGLLLVVPEPILALVTRCTFVLDFIPKMCLVESPVLHKTGLFITAASTRVTGLSIKGRGGDLPLAPRGVVLGVGRPEEERRVCRDILVDPHLRSGVWVK